MRKGTKRSFGLLALLAALFLLLGLLLGRPQLRDESPNLSFSSDTDGLQAWRELLDERHPLVGEWRLRWDELPQGSGRLLIAAEPAGVSGVEWKALEEWLKRGNSALLLGDLPDQPFWELTGSGSAAAEDGDAAGEGDAAEETSDEGSASDNKAGSDHEALPSAVEAEALLGPGAYEALTDTSVRIAVLDGEGSALVADERGTLAARKSVGAGSVTLAVEPRWMQNGTALKGSHAELMGALLEGSWTEMLFDEQHHGYTSAPGAFAVLPRPLLLASALLLLALLLALWSAGKRFGPTRVPREWTTRRGDETVRALAAWYERFGLMDEALDRQRGRLRQQLAQRWGLPASASPEQAAAAARSRWSEEDALRLQRALEERPLQADGRKAARREFTARSKEASELAALLRGGADPGRGQRR
ncbi:DUF4350 domain-containing protein [Paenibacillus albicereus]|uniref:DUF4350 domain-containing protein n=1 Tax=Paenibacillus albicereus TaxID=2726185 RepID=A0A6H2GV60_9BACL|nr:DUF4350 domain-containing protein [Paenibacillus albicereus]QJC51056.1 DUF4350 domain-containing protein [Paenibacillus albicereus]